MSFFVPKGRKDDYMNKIIKRKMTMLTMIFAVMGAVLFIPAKKVSAADDNSGVRITISADNLNSDSTGVNEVDATLNRGNKFLEGLCRFVGFAVAVVSALFFLISLPTHQSDMRNQMIVAFFVGIIIIFVPEIVHAIAGR